MADKSGTKATRNSRRQPHRKSRRGCDQCKQRKVKCDETRPICHNCSRRDGDDCSFLARQEPPVIVQHQYPSHLYPPWPPHHGVADTSNTILEQLATTMREQTAVLTRLDGRLSSVELQVQELTRQAEIATAQNNIDMGLFYHYMTEVAPSMSWREEEGHVWKEKLPEIAFRQPHILSLILCLAAQHKVSQSSSDQHSAILERAKHHHAIGTKGASHAIMGISDETFDVVYLSAVLIGLNTLAIGPQPGDYAAFSDEGQPDFLILLRGLELIKGSHFVKAQPIITLTARVRCRTSRPESVQSPLSSGAINYETHLRILRQALEGSNEMEPQRKKACLEALYDLEPFLIAAYSERHGLDQVTEARIAAAHVQFPFGWLYRASATFSECLMAKEPFALEILACFMVVLKHTSYTWPVEGWAEHIMSGIWKWVPSDDRWLLQWPMESIDWKPRDS